MPSELLQLFGQLQPDPWRRRVGFSAEMEEANKLLFDPSKNAEAALATWLQRHQPCLFGRVAAKLGLIRYCVLREEDLCSDEAVRDTIQEARHSWTDDALDGEASAFVILLISERLANAVPDEVTAKIAIRLCSLYLRDADVLPDKILHERVWLEKPGPRRITWEWLAGVNYFCAQGDGRWWQDHRIPGGMAFSVNSVGHLAKSAKIAQVLNELNEVIGVGDGEFSEGTIRSLDDALVYAMRTIDNASDAISGPATELLAAVDADADTCPCPIKLPPTLAGKNHCVYSGWYHTDYTVPAEYFRATVERPSDTIKHNLDFTYLFWDDVENPAHETMGTGRRIRADGVEGGQELALEKRHRMAPREVIVDDRERLRALRRFNR
jgi:hypothetical protein